MIGEDPFHPPLKQGVFSVNEHRKVELLILCQYKVGTISLMRRKIYTLKLTWGHSKSPDFAFVLVYSLEKKKIKTGH